MSSFSRTIERKGRFKVSSGISEDVRGLQRQEAEKFHIRAVFSGLDVKVAELLQERFPDRDAGEHKDRLARARKMKRDHDDLAKRLAAHAAVVRAEFDPIVTQKINDERLPFLRRQRDRVKEMLAHPDLYSRTLQEGIPGQGSWDIPPMTIEQAEWYLAQHEVALEVLEAYVEADEEVPVKRTKVKNKPHTNGKGTVENVKKKLEVVND